MPISVGFMGSEGTHFSFAWEIVWCRHLRFGNGSQATDNERTARFRLAGVLSGLRGTHRSVAAAAPHYCGTALWLS